MVKFKSPPCDQLDTYGSNKIMIIKYERLERRNKKKWKKKGKIKKFKPSMTTITTLFGDVSSAILSSDPS